MARRRWLTRFSRVPIRARLTIAFVAMMATVLGAAGVFVYVRFASTLDTQVSDALRVAAAGGARRRAGGPGPPQRDRVGQHPDRRRLPRRRLPGPGLPRGRAAPRIDAR